MEKWKKETAKVTNLSWEMLFIEFLGITRGVTSTTAITLTASHHNPVFSILTVNALLSIGVCNYPRKSTIRHMKTSHSQRETVIVEQKNSSCRTFRSTSHQSKEYVVELLHLLSILCLVCLELDALLEIRKDKKWTPWDKVNQCNLYNDRIYNWIKMLIVIKLVNRNMRGLEQPRMRMLRGETNIKKWNHPDLLMRLCIKQIFKLLQNKLAWYAYGLPYFTRQGRVETL